jgi:hypothetical protein
MTVGGDGAGCGWCSCLAVDAAENWAVAGCHPNPNPNPNPNPALSLSLALALSLSLALALALALTRWRAGAPDS